jgi:hypothetical protein
MSLPRKLEPEMLDQLPADDPRAIRSRRELKRINAFMMHNHMMARGLLQHLSHDQPPTLLDLGAGDGTFMLAVARRLGARWKDVSVILLDRQNIVSSKTREAFAALGWKIETVTADLFEFLGARPRLRLDVITANLFLHHLTDAELTRLFVCVAQSARLFMAFDPRRTAWVREMSRSLWMLGCNEVSVHDAVASTRAGFLGKELTALWPPRAGWVLQEREAGLFSHSFVAAQPQT